jgi:hypothetical protein
VVPGFPGYGTLIQVRTSSGPPEVYQSIAGAGDITGPGSQVGTVETTSHSTGAPIRTYIPGLIELGDISFPCYWNPTDPTMSVNSPFGLEALFYNRITTKFQLVLPDPSHRTRQFLAFVKQLNETHPVQGVSTRAVALHITSVLTDVAPAIFMAPQSATATAAGVATPSTFQFTAGGSNAPWQALPSDTWIHITSPVGLQVGDSSIVFTVDPNPNPGQARTGYISIGAFQLQFAITQAGS